MKTCTKCLENKPKSAFHQKATCKDGLFQWCIQCHRVITKTRQAELRKNLDFIAKESKKVANWRKNNFEKYYANFQSYCAQNRAKLANRTARYRSKKLQRTPSWLTDTDKWMIEEAYDLAALRTRITGVVWHVDHIIPLQGELVSGLHTPYNLQVIVGKINQSKSNYFAVT
jgi:hypothetical protein